LSVVLTSTKCAVLPSISSLVIQPPKTLDDGLTLSNSLTFGLPSGRYSSNSHKQMALSKIPFLLSAVIIIG